MISIVSRPSDRSILNRLDRLTEIGSDVIAPLELVSTAKYSPVVSEVAETRSLVNLEVA